MKIQSRLQSLLKINEELNRLQNPDGVLDRMMDLALETMDASRGFIIIRKGNARKNSDVIVARKMNQDIIRDQLNISNSVLNQTMEAGSALLTYDALADKRFENSESIQMHGIHSIACVPLKKSDSVLGAIYVDNPDNVGKFNQETVEYLEAFAHLANVALENSHIIQQLKNENDTLRESVTKESQYSRMIGNSPQIREIYNVIEQVTKSEATVLIEGESGTGKELVAQAIHERSHRRDAPFIPIYCGSLSENLLESELFGHRKGAFTGAIENKPGLFEEADKGTIFLDEIADISKNIQTKLLRVLQNGEIKRVGDTKTNTADVRIIAATNRELWDTVKENQFREDLYYRLNVINIKLPPLRERKEDIELLAAHFLRMYADKNKKYIKGLSNKALAQLKSYDWPGNIRELENAIERAVIMTRSTEIHAEDLKLSRSKQEIRTGMKLKDIEREVVLRTLQECDGNRTKTAQMLGVSRRWLQYQLKNWD
jgi:Nif-specific regulatory protein